MHTDETQMAGHIRSYPFIAAFGRWPEGRAIGAQHISRFSNGDRAEPARFPADLMFFFTASKKS